MTMGWIENLLTEARRIGACDRAKNVTTEEEIVSLLFSPQGREFCSRHGFPTRCQWDRLAFYGLHNRNIFINFGRAAIDISPIENIAVIGDSDMRISVEGSFCKHTIIVGHGASVTIEASNFAVFEVVRIGECSVEVTLDETSVEL